MTEIEQLRQRVQELEQQLTEVRRAERERCAKVCDSVAAKRWPNDIGPEAEECAAAIRAME